MPDAVIKATIVMDGLGNVTTTLHDASTQVHDAAEEMSKGFEKAQEGAEHLSYSMAEARHTAMGFGEIAGLHIPRMVSTMLAHMQSLGPVLAEAFPVVGAALLVTFLAEKIPDALEKASGAITGWDERAKAAYKDLIDENQKYIDATERLAEGQSKIGLIGLTGAAKAQKDFEGVQSDIKRVSEERITLDNRSKQLAKELEESHGTLGRTIKTAGDAWLDGSIKVLRTEKEIEEELKRVNSQLAEKTVKLQQLQLVESPTAATNLTVAKAQADREAGLAVVDAAKQAGLARIATEEGVYKAHQQLRDLSMEEDLKAAVAQANREADLPNRDATKDAALTQAATEQAIYEENQKFRQQSIDEELNQAAVLERERYQIDLDYFSKKRAAIQLESKQTGKDARAELDALHGQEEQAEQQHQQKIEGIVAKREVDTEKLNRQTAASITETQARLQTEESRKLQEATQQIIAQFKDRVDKAKQMAEEIHAHQQSMIDLELEAAKEADRVLVESHHISQKKQAEDEEMALRAATEKKKKILQEELAVAKANYGEQSVQYKKLVDQIELADGKLKNDITRLWDDVRLKTQKTWDGINRQVSHDLAAIATGHETLKQAVGKVYDTIVTDIADKLIQMGLRWAEHFIMVDLLHMASGQKQAAQTAAAAAEQHATIAAENVGEVSSEAAVAGAKAYAAYAELPPVAAAMAAEAVMSVMAFAPMAAFEKGGMVPETMTALVHKGEGVFAPGDMATLKDVMTMATSGRGGGAAPNVNFHYHGSDPKKDMPNMEAQFKKMVKKVTRNVSWS